MRMIQAIFIDFLCIGYVPCPIAYIMEKMEVKSENFDGDVPRGTTILF